MSWFATMCEDTVLILGRDGSIPTTNPDGWGLYREDCRHLSGLEFFIDGHGLVLLSASEDRNGAFHYVYTNPPDALELPPSDRGGVGEINMAQGSVVIRRKTVVLQGSVHERFEVVNYYINPIDITLDFRFAADFADIFEVRGWVRPKRGTVEEMDVQPGELHFQYLGLDQTRRHTRIRFGMPPDETTLEVSRFRLHLEPHVSHAIEFSVFASSDDRPLPKETLSFTEAMGTRIEVAKEWRSDCARVETDWPDLNELLDTSLRDLGVLRRHYPSGPMLVAGLPWYAVPFGRDSLLAAWEMRAFHPELLKGVLRYLAKHQARELDDFRDAEPGKIPHEMRDCETSRVGEVPFGPYYGSIDSTLLFVGMLAEAERWLGDRSLADELWPNVIRAQAWMGQFGDELIAYSRRSAIGLVHQGWKDSRDPINYPDGREAQPPIALIEVQGYAYWAWLSLAGLAERRGDDDLAARARQSAERMKALLEEWFWLPDLGWYAVAIADNGRRVITPASNMGHAMLFGPVAGERASSAVRRLMQDDMFSGWGIRTLSTEARRYNPLSYHNGVVWPHDVALVAAGMAASGHPREAAEVTKAVWEAGIRSPGKVLPELISGFSRGEAGHGPIPYPLACGPQAWASAAALSLLTTVLGLTVEGGAERVWVSPHLPEGLGYVKLSGLRVGDRTVDLEFSGAADRVEVRQLRGTAEVVRSRVEERGVMAGSW